MARLIDIDAFASTNLDGERVINEKDEMGKATGDWAKKVFSILPS